MYETKVNQISSKLKKETQLKTYGHSDRVTDP